MVLLGDEKALIDALNGIWVCWEVQVRAETVSNENLRVEHKVSCRAVSLKSVKVNDHDS